jgi:Ala-tRNA(Pro) deacylase
MKDIYNILDELGIFYERNNHEAVYTVAESEKIRTTTDAGETKNLFLRNKKGDRHYLVVVSSKKKVDLKNLRNLLCETNLSFASDERLLEYLGLTPGSVSPFGLINDESNQVSVVIDTDLLKHKKVGFHPNINTATLALSIGHFRKFLEWTGNEVLWIGL